MSVTYEEILQEMLGRVPGNVDRREGSIIYDALAPCAYFLAQQNFQLEHFTDLVFADTAVGNYLDLAVAPYGIVRKKATPAVRKMEASATVDAGSRWGIHNLVYRVTEKIENDIYEVICEMEGEIGNRYSGDLEPISDSSGVTARLTDIITAGTDEESDESLRERFYTRVRLPATSGNAYHYQQWAQEVAGVGAAKVFPLDKGPGTVTVLVVNDDKEIDAGLPDVVADYLERVRPIGATVSVESPEALAVDVSARVLLDGSRTLEEVRAAYEGAVDAFLKEMVFETYRVSYAKLGSLLLDIAGVEDFDGFLLNSGSGNVVIGEKEIAVLGGISLVEVSTLGAD